MDDQRKAVRLMQDYISEHISEDITIADLALYSLSDNGKGISKEGDILDIAVNMDIIEKSGSWFSYNGARIGQGRENVKLLLIYTKFACLLSLIMLKF